MIDLTMDNMGSSARFSSVEQTTSDRQVLARQPDTYFGFGWYQSIYRERTHKRNMSKQVMETSIISVVIDLPKLRSADQKVGGVQALTIMQSDSPILRKRWGRRLSNR